MSRQRVNVHAEDMHLDGRFDQAKQAVHNAVSKTKQAFHHTGQKIHHTGQSLLHRISNRHHPSGIGPTHDGMASNIDLCECSRRVQGHLAILYPELH